MTACPDTPATSPAPPVLARGADAARQTAGNRLESLLADPIVQLLMERDGVERDVLLRMARKVRRRVHGCDDVERRLP